MNISLRFASRAAAPAFAAFCGMWCNPALRPAQAQDAPSRVESRIRDSQRAQIRQLPSMFSQTFPSGNRAVIGVTIGSTGRADTLGVLVSDVTRGGPADKAGIKEGTRITAINGVNLRVSGNDADDEELLGVGQRRLQREVAKVKAGDEVELRVSEGGQSRTLKVKTITAGDLDDGQSRALTAITRENLDKRPSLGVSIGGTGSYRDTLGLFVSSVVTDGPAEKAGVFEGDRIAAINGADVRVPREDAEDGQAMSARLNRFMRELNKAAPGDRITLKVYTGGHYRDVQVTAGKSSDLRSSGLRLNFGDTPMMLSRPGVSGRSVIVRRGTAKR